MERSFWTDEDEECPKLWPSWTDTLGQEYKPGDFVVYASLVGRSAQLTFGRVIEIRRVDGEGNQIRRSDWDREAGVYVRAPGAKVQIQPILDSIRGYGRSEGADGVTRPALVEKTENILRFDPPVEWTDEFLTGDLAALAAELSSHDGTGWLGGTDVRA